MSLRRETSRARFLLELATVVENSPGALGTFDITKDGSLSNSRVDGNPMHLLGSKSPC